MAHTLTLTDYLGTATDLASTGTTAGYKLSESGYSTMAATPEVYYNTSILANGSLPVYSRTGNVIETISIDIYGSSRDDALTKLSYLQRALWMARDSVEKPNLRAFTYLSFKPDGSTNTAYAILLGGTATAPQNWLDTNLNDNKILGVVVIVEREPYWRGNAPIISTTLSTFSTVLVNSQTLTPDWGRYDITAALGDVPGLPILRVDAGLSVFWTVAGYSSELRAGTPYNSAGVVEGESLTLAGGVTIAGDANCSGAQRLDMTPGTSFATMATGQITLHGAYRVFARVAVAAASTGTYYLTWGNEAVLQNTNAQVTATHNPFGMVDLGVVMSPTANATLNADAEDTQIYFSLITKSSGGGTTVHLDFLFFMPLEYYWSSRSPSTGGGGAYTFYDRTIPWGGLYGNASIASSRPYVNLFAKTQGALAIPPGSGSLYLLHGNSATTYLNSNSNAKTINLYYVPLYTSARGNR